MTKTKRDNKERRMGERGRWSTDDDEHSAQQRSDMDARSNINLSNSNSQAESNKLDQILSLVSDMTTAQKDLSQRMVVLERDASRKTDRHNTAVTSKTSKSGHKETVNSASSSSSDDTDMTDYEAPVKKKHKTTHRTVVINHHAHDEHERDKMLQTKFADLTRKKLMKFNLFPEINQRDTILNAASAAVYHDAEHWCRNSASKQQAKKINVNLRTAFKAKLVQARPELKALGLKAGFETIEAVVAAGYHIHERYDVQASPKLKTRSLKAGLQATETVQAAGYHIRDLGLSDIPIEVQYRSPILVNALKLTYRAQSDRSVPVVAKREGWESFSIPIIAFTIVLVENVLLQAGELQGNKYADTNDRHIDALNEIKNDNRQAFDAIMEYLWTESNPKAKSLLALKVEIEELSSPFRIRDKKPAWRDADALLDSDEDGQDRDKDYDDQDDQMGDNDEYPDDGQRIRDETDGDGSTIEDDGHDAIVVGLPTPVQKPKAPSSRTTTRSKTNAKTSTAVPPTSSFKQSKPHAYRTSMVIGDVDGDDRHRMEDLGDDGHRMEDHGDDGHRMEYDGGHGHRMENDGDTDIEVVMGLPTPAQKPKAPMITTRSKKITQTPVAPQSKPASSLKKPSSPLFSSPPLVSATDSQRLAARKALERDLQKRVTWNDGEESPVSRYHETPSDSEEETVVTLLPLAGKKSVTPHTGAGKEGAKTASDSAATPHTGAGKEGARAASAVTPYTGARKEDDRRGLLFPPAAANTGKKEITVPHINLLFQLATNTGDKEVGDKVLPTGRFAMVAARKMEAATRAAENGGGGMVKLRGRPAPPVSRSPSPPGGKRKNAKKSAKGR